LFGEDQARYLVTTGAAPALLAAAERAGVPARAIGRTGGNSLILAEGEAISLAELRAGHEGWLPNYMAR
jgi:phosphoribosylformylglycinamidine synthase